MRPPSLVTLASLLIPLLLSAPAGAGHLRDFFGQRNAAGNDMETDGTDSTASVALPAGASLHRDTPYGPHKRQRMDVYLPAAATPPQARRPIIVMVHGGAWRFGDKAMRRVVENKIRHWLPRGFILVSTNYRLLPDAAPLEQARDVARAVARTQALATEWGGDPERVVLMGHSAGAHLVALLNANPAEALALGARPWRGAVALDSAAMDIRPIMEARHPSLYDKAFGNVPSNWDRVSPLRQLVSGAPPLLAVCSSQRSDSCRQAEGLQARAQTLGVRIEVQPQDLSHGEINGRLGLPGPYTAAVTAFVDSLLPAQP